MFLHFFSHTYNTIGIIGVILVLVAYLLLQIDKLSQDSVTFSLTNFLGSIFILISLYFKWNLPSGIIEICWLLISFYGLIKSLFFIKKQKFKPQ